MASPSAEALVKAYFEGGNAAGVNQYGLKEILQVIAEFADKEE